MPATVIAERIGWEHSSSVLCAKVAELRPLYAPNDPADRTIYADGEIVQCDLWFPGKVIPIEAHRGVQDSRLGRWAFGGGSAGPHDGRGVLGVHHGSAVAARKTGDLLAGMWQLLSGSGGVAVHSRTPLSAATASS